ncbi:MAG: amino acid permease [Pseudomonadota bacterium]
MKELFRRKSIDQLIDHNAPNRLRPTLSAWHLVLLGVGAIVGTGIYVLVGVGAERAGPAIIISFAIAGVICACAALAYAELATMMPASGSAYTYSYASMGELVAWVVGWALILEYSVVCSAVAVGWAGYAVSSLQDIGIDLPRLIIAGPKDGGLVNFPAIFVIAVITSLLLIGVRESATVNSWLVLIKITALVVFVVVAFRHFSASNFSPFMPEGFLPHNVRIDDETVRYGVMPAAAITFFAFYGFDAVSTAAEETKDPGRNLAIGVMGSMIICTIIYMAVCAAAIGALPIVEFAKAADPLAFILRSIGYPAIATGLSLAVVLGIPTVILAFMYGQSRIFFVMARDGLLPRQLGTVHAKTGAPVAMTIITGVVCALMAGILPLSEIVELANAGTLAAFVATAAALMILRIREPNRARPFKAPLAFVVGTAAIIGCIFLFYNLPYATQIRFFIWMAIGLVVYFVFSRGASVLSKQKGA